MKFKYLCKAIYNLLQFILTLTKTFKTCKTYEKLFFYNKMEQMHIIIIKKN